MQKSIIGSQAWKNGTVSKLDRTDEILKFVRKSLENANRTDASLLNKDFAIELSNKHALKYSRLVQVVIGKLRAAILEQNTEIKAVHSVKAEFEKLMANVRKNLQINKETILIRAKRPPREKLQDGADDLLTAESTHLKNIKNDLEISLKSVYEHLQQLNERRLVLIKILNERLRVVELLNHSSKRTASSDTRRMIDRDCMEQKCATISTDSASSQYGSESSKCLIDPLSSYTPACENALNEAALSRHESQKFRQQLAGLLKRIENFQQVAGKLVEDSLLKKSLETNRLKQQIELMKAQTRTASNRANRWFDFTERAFSHTQGPSSSKDLLVREKLNRPLIKVMQRHPGMQVPEAQEIIKAGENLQKSLFSTRNDLEMLNSAKNKLNSDMLVKQKAMQMDLAALRTRRCNSQLHWSIKDGHPGLQTSK